MVQSDNNNHLNIGLSDVNKTEEGKSAYQPPSSGENIPTFDQEEKEDIDLAEATEDLVKAKEQHRIPPAQDKLASKLENELKKQIDRTRSLQDSVKGIQKQLLRIDKTLYSIQTEHEVIRKKHAQFNLIQKRVDSIDKSIRTWKSKAAAIKRKIKPKLAKKKKQAHRSTSKRR
jgi:archaellum component FlaC